MPMLPTGPIIVLFTDIQGSPTLWERDPEKLAAALQVHNSARLQAIQVNSGVVFTLFGEAFYMAWAEGIATTLENASSYFVSIEAHLTEAMENFSQ